MDMYDTHRTATSNTQHLTNLFPGIDSVVIIKSNSANCVDHSFWFAPVDWNVASRAELNGHVLLVPELLHLEHEYVRPAEAHITTKLYAMAVNCRNKLHNV